MSNGKTSSEPKKFGTLMGVYIPSVLTILGVIMYLRMGWVVGSAGLLGTIVIVTVSSLITYITGLSISSTATNMQVRTGGAYYMISRSFGIESGAAIGIPLFLAQAVGISFYIVGFAESLEGLFPGLPVKEVGLASLLLLTALAYFSPEVALKAQVFIFAIILLSLVTIIFGSPVKSYQMSTALVEKASFWAVFAIFFPAVTGILSGVSMSGDLKDPAKSIPRGTLAAVITGFVIYLGIPIILLKLAPEKVLLSEPLVMTKVSFFPPLIYAGIWGATLSSALGSLLAAPRTLQALSNDRVMPKIFGKGFGPSNDPRLATALSFIIAAAGIYLGTLDVIAPILTMFFLTSYGILNFISGVETLVQNPSWRPTFKVHWIVSFAGALSCFSVMMFIDPAYAYLGFIFCGIVYLFFRRRNIRTSWSDSRRGLMLHMIRNQIYKLASLEESGKTWRPNLFILSGSPTSRWNLIKYAHSISQGKGFLTVCSILKPSSFTAENTKDKLNSIEKSMSDFLEKKGIQSLTKVKVADDFVDGVSGIIDDYGLGHISPNTFVLGETRDEEKQLDSSELIKLIYRANKNLLIIRHYDKDDDGESEEDVRPKSGREKLQGSKVIDIWWGHNTNAHLMLVFAYMMQTSPTWAGSKLRIRSLVDDEDQRLGVMKNLQETVETGRLKAEIEVFVRKKDVRPFDQIAKYSKETDLVFIGMRSPEDQESADEYSNYYEELMIGTENFPTTIITLRGEPLNFQDIFKD